MCLLTGLFLYYCRTVPAERFLGVASSCPLPLLALFQAFVSLNWLLSEDNLDLETELAFGFLNFLMLGTPASPLTKALMDSGLGEAIIGGGLEDELRQPLFSIGLKGVDPANLDKVQQGPQPPPPPSRLLPISSPFGREHVQCF